MSESGHLVSINYSNGGVPKLPVAEAMVTVNGIDGDRQRDRRFHGGPNRAVSIFSADRIHDLQAEGHPIATGSTGENLTVSGVDWNLVSPGSLMEIGEILLEVVSYTKPCKTIRESFIEQKFTRMSQKHYPGWSRVYARVLREGRIRTGDPVQLTPMHEASKSWLESLLA
ncbi:MAG TPA: MOSC domain-containing protein [Gemmatimonadaceae bacterium]|nr:MOSC domain-containing protein [Gemmatimonadaceae bacterium]